MLRYLKRWYFIDALKIFKITVVREIFINCVSFLTQIFFNSYFIIIYKDIWSCSHKNITRSANRLDFEKIETRRKARDCKSGTRLIFDASITSFFLLLLLITKVSRDSVVETIWRSSESFYCWISYFILFALALFKDLWFTCIEILACAWNSCMSLALSFFLTRI